MTSCGIPTRSRRLGALLPCARPRPPAFSRPLARRRCQSWARSQDQCGDRPGAVPGPAPARRCAARAAAAAQLLSRRTSFARRPGSALLRLCHCCQKTEQKTALGCAAQAFAGPPRGKQAKHRFQHQRAEGIRTRGIYIGCCLMNEIMWRTAVSLRLARLPVHSFRGSPQRVHTLREQGRGRGASLLAPYQASGNRPSTSSKQCPCPCCSPLFSCP